MLLLLAAGFALAVAALMLQRFSLVFVDALFASNDVHVVQGVKVGVKELEVQRLHVNRELLVEIKQVGNDSDSDGDGDGDGEARQGKARREEGCKNSPCNCMIDTNVCSCPLSLAPVAFFLLPSPCPFPALSSSSQ